MDNAINNNPRSVKDYFKDLSKRGKLTQRMLEENLDNIRVVLTTDVGKELLFEDIQKFETLLYKLIDKGYGYEKDQVTDDDLVEMRYLKNRIFSITKRIHQFLEYTGNEV